MYSILKTTAIQNELIINYQNYNITKEELICLFQLFTFDPLQIELLVFLKETNDNKPFISSLAAKNLIHLGTKDEKIMIDLMPLYKSLNQPSEKLESIGLTREQIDKLVHIFGKPLKPHEINKINSWMEAGATFNKIEEAIYTAFSREVKNLNYIEKIIVNNNSTSKEVSHNQSPITRNWTY